LPFAELVLTLYCNFTVLCIPEFITLCYALHTGVSYTLRRPVSIASEATPLSTHIGKDEDVILLKRDHSCHVTSLMTPTLWWLRHLPIH